MSTHIFNYIYYVLLSHSLDMIYAIMPWGRHGIGDVIPVVVS